MGPTMEEEVKMTLPPGMLEEDHVEETRAQKCVDCCKKFITFLVSTVGLSTLMIAWTILGGFIFKMLESDYEKQMKQNVQLSQTYYVDKLWNMTESLNVIYPDKWRLDAHEILQNYTHFIYRATKEQGWDGTGGETEMQWTFAGALLYSVTVITTIGYGHISPKTPYGRIVTIFYAIIGIPLTLLCLANLGGFMATAFRFLYSKVCCGLFCCCCRRKKDKRGVNVGSVKYKDKSNGDTSAACALTSEDSPRREPDEENYTVRVFVRSGTQKLIQKKASDRVSVPIIVSFLLIASYILLGALMFTLWQTEWNFLTGCYFCFITLTTIGFGDYVPGTQTDSSDQQAQLVLCTLYLVVGLALIAMCFDLMQEEVRNKCRHLGRKLGIVKDT